jgi:hypothetical protein
MRSKAHVNYEGVGSGSSSSYKQLPTRTPEVDYCPTPKANKSFDINFTMDKFVENVPRGLLHAQNNSKPTPLTLRSV